MRYLLAALTLAACQPLEPQPGPQGPAGPPGPMGVMGDPGRDAQGSITDKDGTRIKVKRRNVYMTSEDGAKVLTGSEPKFYDSKFDILCAPRYSSDGKQRCLPTTEAENPFFLDSACTKRFTHTSTTMGSCGNPAPPASPPPKFIRVRTPGSSPCVLGAGGDDVYAVGPEVIPSPATVYEKGESCTARPNTFKDFHIYEVSDKQPITDFAVVGSIQALE